MGRHALSVETVAAKSVTRLREAFSNYIANADPRAATANLVAASILFNQPFYPLYLWFLAERAALPALLTFLSSPFFAAVPILARNHSIAGRALMAAAGAGNTFLCAKIFGQASGVELFLIPCAILCVLLFRLAEWKYAAALIATMAAFWFALDGNYGPAMRDFTGDEQTAMFRLNAISVASLSAFLAILAIRQWWSARKI
jgi:hypothetical protein